MKRECNETVWQRTAVEPDKVFYQHIIIFRHRGAQRMGVGLQKQPSSWQTHSYCSHGIGITGRRWTTLTGRLLASRNRGQECWQKASGSLWNPSMRAWLSSRTHPRPPRSTGRMRPEQSHSVEGPLTKHLWCSRNSTHMSCWVSTTTLWGRSVWTLPWPPASILPHFFYPNQQPAFVQTDNMPAQRIWLPRLPCSSGRPCDRTLAREQSRELLLSDTTGQVQLPCAFCLPPSVVPSFCMEGGQGAWRNCSHLTTNHEKVAGQEARRISESRPTQRYYYLHFTEGKTEAWKDDALCTSSRRRPNRSLSKCKFHLLSTSSV